MLSRWGAGGYTTRTRPEALLDAAERIAGRRPGGADRPPGRRRGLRTATRAVYTGLGSRTPCSPSWACGGSCCFRGGDAPGVPGRTIPPRTTWSRQ
ncbi:hypothetical protein HBB16_21190 [Pseudonocardia sp. MCCB 268]|nr:hypothetical protein [Pseudonocardia cytotoxica]